MKHCVCCSESDFDVDLISITLVVYKPSRPQPRLFSKTRKLIKDPKRKLISAPSFRVCADCVKKWTHKNHLPALRSAFRESLKNVFKRICEAPK